MLHEENYNLHGVDDQNDGGQLVLDMYASTALTWKAEGEEPTIQRVLPLLARVAANFPSVLLHTRDFRGDNVAAEHALRQG